MRMIQLAFALILGFAIHNDTNAGTKSVRASVRAECMQVAAAQNFRKRYILRTFIKNCVIDPEFNAPDRL